MRVVPREWRREGVVECLKNEQIAAIVEEAEIAEANKGYYDEDGNWIYYEEYEQEEQVPEVQPPQKQPQQKQPIQQNHQPIQNNLQKQSNKQEVKAAADEATKAAQEAAKAAKEASASLAKGFASFGFGGGNKDKKQSAGGLLGGLVKAASNAVAEPAPVVAKPKVKPQDPKFPKPYTLNMTAKQRWQWAYRRIVQVDQESRTAFNRSRCAC